MRLGVDFGTTTTAIAIVDRGNYPIVSFVDNNDDTVDFVPSIIALDGDRLVYGFDAEDAARDGAPHLRSFKRLLSDPSVTDTSTLRLGNHSISILEVLTGFLTYVAHQLRTNSSIASLPDSEPLEALVGVPAHAWSAQRFLSLEAFRRAGWHVLAMVNEPSAAGFEYTHRHAGTLNSKRTAILVYDLGGGTFDASIVSATGTLHEVMGSRGLNMVGGDDFDVVLATRLAAAAGTDSGKLGEAAWERLIEDARDAKETLSPSTKFITVPVDGEPVTIPVADFYEAASALVEATIAAMEPLLVHDASGVGQLGGDIAGLYVVGGGSQLPLVARMLRSRFGRRVHRSPHTAASTAIGLAIGADPEAAYTVREQLSRGVGVFREREAGSLISFDTLLEPNTELAPGETLTIKRRYRAAHNIGYFRFVEYSSFDEAGVPRGDLQPYGEVIVPFDRALRRDDVDLSTVPVIRTDRAGSATWHGPGQVVVYPVVRLREPVDLVQWIRAVEASVIDTVREIWDLPVHRVEGRAGVWLTEEGRRDRKICAIGLKVARGVTLHGIALNVDIDPAHAFEGIIPCGLTDADVTSLSWEGIHTTVSDAASELLPRMVEHISPCLATTPTSVSYTTRSTL